jgi:hypothetical protein
MPGRRPHPVVTDHAVLRYLERALGLDVEAVRAEVEARVETGLHHGAGKVVVGGMRYVLRDGRVVTVQRARRPAPSRPPRYREAPEADHGR